MFTIETGIPLPEERKPWAFFLNNMAIGASFLIEDRHYGNARAAITWQHSMVKSGKRWSMRREIGYRKYRIFRLK